MTLLFADTDPEVLIREPDGAATRAQNPPPDISPGRGNFESVSVAWRDIATRCCVSQALPAGLRTGCNDEENAFGFSDAQRIVEPINRYHEAMAQ